MHFFTHKHAHTHFECIRGFIQTENIFRSVTLADLSFDPRAPTLFNTAVSNTFRTRMRGKKGFDPFLFCNLLTFNHGQMTVGMIESLNPYGWPTNEFAGLDAYVSMCFSVILSKKSCKQRGEKQTVRLN